MNATERSEYEVAKEATNRGFSIITNFGCNARCWYCVWRNDHKLKHQRTSFESTDWTKLRSLICAYPGEKINISGGGDPLFNFARNRRWWDSLVCIAEHAGKKIDIHTRETQVDQFLLEKTNKFVLSFDSLEEVKKRLILFPGKKVRLTRVITADASIEEIRKAAQFAFSHGYELTFKQLYGFDDGGAFVHLQEKTCSDLASTGRGVRFLNHEDYNVYLMPDNRLYESFIVGATGQSGS